MAEPWCIPPQANADFVWAMEEVLEVYGGQDEENNPLICMDEASKQWVKEVRTLIPAQASEPEKYDAQYEHHGGGRIFMFSEPLTGKGFAKVSETRTAVDWAHQIQERVDVHSPTAERIT